MKNSQKNTGKKKKKEKMVVQNCFHGFDEDSDDEEDCQSNSIVIKMEEIKDNYKHLLFQEEDINIIEMKYNTEQNKLLD